MTNRPAKFGSAIVAIVASGFGIPIVAGTAQLQNVLCQPCAPARSPGSRFRSPVPAGEGAGMSGNDSAVERLTGLEAVL